MKDIKQNNENSYNFFGVHISSDENLSADNVVCDIPSLETSLIVRLIIGKIQTLTLFCLGLVLRKSNDDKILIERMVKGIIIDINYLAIPEIYELFALCKNNSEHVLDKILKLTPLKEILNALKNRLKNLRIEVKKPENANLISNKIFQRVPQISKDLCHDKETEAIINIGKRENEDKIGVILKISDEEGYALSKPISQFDSNVICAVYTLSHNGNVIFSVKDICEILTGGNKRPEKLTTLLSQIEKSLDRLATTRMTINTTEQAKQHGYEIKKVILTSYLLPLEKVEVLFKGSQQVETAYRLIGEPAIFEYSRNMKQFITIPLKLLKLDKATPELICLRIAVLKRVFCVCYGNMKYNRLAIETLLKEAGIEIQYKTQKQRYIKAIKQTLELLKDKKFLEDFTTVTKKSEGQKGRPTLQSFQLVPIFKKLNSPSQP